MLIIIFWFLCVIIGAILGHRKGELIGGLLFGLLLGPIGVVIVLLHKGNRQACPYCRELMHKEATVCPHCQRALTEIPAA